MSYDQRAAKSDLQVRSFRAGTEDFGGNLGSEGFETREGAAGGDAGPFEERGVQDEGAAVHEGMIGRFEGFARAARNGSARDEIFVHFEIGLKIEGVTDIPAVMTRETREKFLPKGRGLLPGHGLGFAVVFGVQASGYDFQGAGGDGEQGFALEKIQKIAVKNGVDLQAVTAVFNHIGIDEARDGAFAEEGFAEALGQNSGQFAGGRPGFRIRRHEKFPY